VPNDDLSGKPRVPAPFQIPSLDGLRAVSFGFVFAAHAGLYHVVPGAFGVTVFFFLSGFLITTLMRREYEKTGTFSLPKFYLRRVLRIFPPFYIVLVLALLCAATGVVPGGFTLEATLAQALHYSNYRIIEHGYTGLPLGTGVYWSLAVEEHFYLLFPWIYFGLVRLRASGSRQALLIFVLCAVLFAWRTYLVVGANASEARASLSSDTRFDSLLFGCALAVYENPALDRSALPERTWKYALLPFGIAGLLASFLYRDPTFRETFRYTLQGISLIPVFVCAIRYPDWGPMRLLNLRPLAFLGVLSYSLYLMHQVVLYAAETHVGDTLGKLATGLVSLAVTILLSWLMYLSVEKPCAALRKRLRVG
jgi:peptidoglycan/LPS O-acetylase OafA/YrhL